MLERLGVRIASDGRNRLAATPADSLTPELLGALKRYKPELLRWCGHSAGVFSPRPCTACRCDVAGDCYEREGDTDLCGTCRQLGDRYVRSDDPRVWWFFQPLSEGQLSSKGTEVTVQTRPGGLLGTVRGQLKRKTVPTVPGLELFDT